MQKCALFSKRVYILRGDILLRYHKMYWFVQSLERSPSRDNSDICFYVAMYIRAAELMFLFESFKPFEFRRINNFHSYCALPPRCNLLMQYFLCFTCCTYSCLSLSPAFRVRWQDNFSLFYYTYNISRRVFYRRSYTSQLRLSCLRLFT